MIHSVAEKNEFDLRAVDRAVRGSVLFLNEIESIQNETDDYFKDMRRKTLMMTDIKKQNERLIEEQKMSQSEYGKASRLDFDNEIVETTGSKEEDEIEAREEPMSGVSTILGSEESYRQQRQEEISSKTELEIKLSQSAANRRHSKITPEDLAKYA